MLTNTDFYKTGHIKQYPDNTRFVYSNLTARSAKHAPVNKKDFDNKVVFFGLNYYIKRYLMEEFSKFFSGERNVVVKKFKRRMDNALGEGVVSTEHIEALHKLGYLPLLIKALPEGTRVPVGVPMLTIINTHESFGWLTNYIETSLSAAIWKPITVATIAFEYRKMFEKYAEITGADKSFIPVQAHDFSFRGMAGVEDASVSGMGHLLSFIGTDTIPAIDYAEEYYKADSDKEVIGVSVPATEHSVMCMGTKEDEIETFRRLIEDKYPSGIISIVSDTWDFWKVLTEYMPTLKDKIMARDGKVVIRPDSGDPVKIICGDPDAKEGTPEYKGAVECLADVFGTTTTAKGYKTLCEKVGLIYGDSITLERQEEILKRLERKGYSSANIVLGVGSFTYQYVTRDSFGMAMKSTAGIVGNGEVREIFKDPKTDDGTKKSARGFLRVNRKDGELVLEQQVKAEDEGGALVQVFYNDSIYDEHNTFFDIRTRLEAYL